MPWTRRVGTPVYEPAGRYVGRVASVAPGTLVVRVDPGIRAFAPGWPEELVVPVAGIAGLRGDGLVLARPVASPASPLPLAPALAAGPAPPPGAPAAVLPAAAQRGPRGPTST